MTSEGSMHVGEMPQAAAGVLPLLPSMPPGALQQQQSAVRHGMQGPIQSMASLVWHPRAASLSALGHGLSASALHFGFDHLVVDADNNREREREQTAVHQQQPSTISLSHLDQTVPTHRLHHAYDTTGGSAGEKALDGLLSTGITTQVSSARPCSLSLGVQCICIWSKRRHERSRDATHEALST